MVQISAAEIALIAYVVGATLLLLAILGYRITIRMKIPKIFSISVRVRK